MNHLAGILIFVVITLFISCDSNSPTSFDCTQSDLSLNVDAIFGTSSCDVADGSLTVVASGGKEPYKFAINNLAAQPTGAFNGLLPGIYSVKVIDANKCEIELSNVTITAEGFSVNADVQPDNLCLDGNGSVTVTVEDGQSPPYQYQIEGSSFSDNNIFTGLEQGNHSITVRDNNNCTVQLNITIPRGNSGTSWINEVLPIIDSRCATSGCHDGKFRPDLRIYDKAFFYRDFIKKYTQDGSMPFDGPKLNEGQIKLIACWVDDGAPQN
ncbi:MAG TPA: hypothetical protein VFW11_24805 [Cyclobacteriaceae bacterium]|nr:hypothetical protein [Cyclobacteriaceae bacterium]